MNILELAGTELQREKIKEDNPDYMVLLWDRAYAIRKWLDYQKRGNAISKAKRA